MRGRDDCALYCRCVPTSETLHPLGEVVVFDGDKDKRTGRWILSSRLACYCALVLCLPDKEPIFEAIDIIAWETRASNIMTVEMQRDFPVLGYIDCFWKSISAKTVSTYLRGQRTSVVAAELGEDD